MPAKSLCSVFCMRRTSKVLKLIFHFSNAIQSVFRMSCNFFIPRALTSYFSSGAEARRADGFDLTMSYLLGRRASLFLQPCIKMRFFRWAARCARTRNVLFLSAIKFAFFEWHATWERWYSHTNSGGSGMKWWANFADEIFILNWMRNNVLQLLLAASK